MMEVQLEECRTTHAALRSNLEGKLMKEIKKLVRRADNNQAGIAALREAYARDLALITQTTREMKDKLDLATCIEINGEKHELDDVIAEIYHATQGERVSQAFKDSLEQWEKGTKTGRFLTSKIGKGLVIVLIAFGGFGLFHVLVEHTKEALEWAFRIVKSTH